MTSPSLSVPFGAPILSFMPPESGRASATAAPRARTSDAAGEMRRWYEALHAWCDADPGRASAQPPVAAESSGLWGRLAARVQKSGPAPSEELMAGFAERCRDLAMAADRATARGVPFDDGHDEALERREIAVGRLLLAFEQRAELLDLSALRLTALPPGLEGLSCLARLDLSRNPGLRCLPDTLAQCQGLVALVARGCGLTQLPPGLFTLPVLQVLDVSANIDLRALPPEAGHAPALRELKAAQCPLSSLPRGMDRLATLELVDLSHNLRLQELPPCWNPADARLRLAGTPLEIMARVLRPLPLTPRQRGTLAEHLDALSGGWPALQERMRDDDDFEFKIRFLRGGLSLSVRTDWIGTQEACEDAMDAVQGWMRERQPITAARLLELGWLVNCRPAGTERLRTQELASIAPVAAGKAGGATTGQRVEYPAAATLSAHLAALEAWLAQGDPSRVALDPMAAMERAMLLYRAFVALSPLEKGNEPAALAAMDWALQQHGLPPVLLPEDPALPIAPLFSGRRIASGETALELLQEVVRQMDAFVARLARAPQAVATA
ncbi:leucine-rich repeat domain-containing protein [Acidovorax sp. GBBC 3334]|uniref:XopAC/AvrAC family type III secretion system effector n=1 Tax=Acidovorax sp. GBBC 3334 TaxID=2940496 RepID=UPI002303681B|nr:XopAC/AvrAC family type III secretion system effector [Acidovorax sp. GBBC 3334]MDA8455146.1 leucine-rich repeat domain-containing protein [Acidovorax sp. GBBC 3334]